MRFKTVRTAILLLIFTGVAVVTYQQTHLLATWKRPLKLTFYPINADGSSAAARYISALTVQHYHAITNFMETEAKAYGVTLRPLFVPAKGPIITSLPPKPPGNHRAIFKMVSWSLKLRHWLYQHVSSFGLDTSHIRIFIAYHEKLAEKKLAHSYGLQKGLVGVVHAYASETLTEQNNMVIAHELLHILGASDKYGADNQPEFPEGFAEPDKTPLFPQEFAEIMGGRIPQSPKKASMPDSLDHCIIGPKTAGEINW